MSTGVRDSDSNKDRDWLLSVFQKYGHHIQELKFQCPLTLEAASLATTCCTNLQVLVSSVCGTSGPEFELEPTAASTFTTTTTTTTATTIGTTPVNLLGVAAAAPAFGFAATTATPTASLFGGGVVAALATTPAPAPAPTTGFGATTTPVAPVATGFGTAAPVATGFGTAMAVTTGFGAAATVSSTGSLFGSAAASGPTTGTGSGSASATTTGFGAHWSAAPAAGLASMAATTGGGDPFVSSSSSVYTAPPNPQESDVVLSAPIFDEEGDLRREDCTLVNHWGNVTMAYWRAKAEHDWVHSQYLWHLIRANVSLKRVEMPRYNLFPAVRVTGDFVCANLRRLPKLCHLDGGGLLTFDFWTLWAALPAARMEYLSVGRGCEVFPLPAASASAAAAATEAGECCSPAAAGPNLRVLLGEGSTMLDGLVELLEIFPRLEHLRIGTVKSWTKNTTATTPVNEETSLVLPAATTAIGGPFLKHLDASVFDWAVILKLIPSIAKWDTVEMLDEETAAFLASHCPNLESVRALHTPWFIDDMGPDRGDDPANQLLVSHARLRVFDNIHHHIKVDEMLRRPWACMGLEWLSCRIVGVVRLMDEEELVVARVMAPDYTTELTASETRVVERFRQSRAHHRGVYERLASLTRLKHLDLGYENRYPWEYKGGETYVGKDGEEYLSYNGATFDTLELTLESGLGQLAALKDLEMFGFECLNHKIGRAELDWMAKSWPKLKLMYGLDSERLYMIEKCKKRAALREYFQKIRPDVVHDSLFEDNV
ncbi:hypothetical protein DFQ27_009004 [Actinomortierella ambigua]|uniref:Uncharacterized protein n=1 Tax=Actinomortierella ambigua TaxID=1343610 RepID=A0A9P6QHE2_9FUNG|nr:hypothetical protein DFQ27_009004 [Actinomortierella ambigua]